MSSMELKELIHLPVDVEAEEMDLGHAREEDLAFDVDRRPDDEEDADVDALDTDDEAEDQALGIDAEESDGELYSSLIVKLF